MITDLVQIRRLGEKKTEENKRLRTHMKSHPVAERRLRRIAEGIEDQIDCTVCANCCRQATVTLKEREIDVLARAIGASRQEFLKNYTQHSEEEGLILRRSEQGCVFLSGTLCTIYDIRPMTCQDFPHLARGPGSILFRMWHMPDRACYCPIAYNTLEAFKQETGFSTRK